MLENTIVATEAEEEKLIEFFKGVDDDFSPPLSKRPGGIDAFVRKVYDEGGAIVIDSREKINATVAFFPYKEGFYVHWHASSKETRGEYRMIKIYQQAAALAYEQNPNAKVYGETWKDNTVAIELMLRLGMVYKYSYCSQDAGLRLWFEGGISRMYNPEVNRLIFKKTG